MLQCQKLRHLSEIVKIVQPSRNLTAFVLTVGLIHRIHLIHSPYPTNTCNIDPKKGIIQTHKVKSIFQIYTLYEFIILMQYANSILFTYIIKTVLGHSLSVKYSGQIDNLTLSVFKLLLNLNYYNI